MKKVELKDLKPYNPPDHFDMKAFLVHQKTSSGEPKYWMGLSHFLPGGGADMATAPVEIVYFVLEGELTVKTEAEVIKLKKWESLHIMPGESRAVINETGLPASMLVIV